MTAKIDLKEEYLKAIKEILNKHFSLSTKVWIFGSRVTGKAKKFSDVDLVIDDGQAISAKIMAVLRTDFEESNLPYKIDVVDWHAISDDFKKIIQKDRVAIN